MAAHWIRSNSVVSEELDGGMLLVDAATGARWLLNAAACAVWRLCDGTRAAGDAAEFCAALAGAGLLRPAVALSSEARMSVSGVPSFQPLGKSAGPRRRPGPRGVSGPV